MRLRDRLEAMGSPLPAAARGVVQERMPLAGSALGRVPQSFHDQLDRAERIAQLRALIAQTESDFQRAQAPLRNRGPRPLPFGTRCTTPAGELHRIERVFEPEHCHGRVTVSDALKVDTALLGTLAFAPELAGVDLSRMLILDTETTGLSGGSGTVPFLIGMGGFEDGVFQLEQLFLHNLGSERPLLARLAERIAQASVLVTYNGKAFDWPLLRTRFIMNRLALPEAPPHLDLLHCARRVLKPRLARVRLTEVEYAVLGLRREDDIDGAQIPALYLGYLRGEDPQALAGVLTHNESDVIALAALMWRLCAHFERVQAEDDPSDHLAYATVALRAGDFARAQSFAHAVAAGAGAPAQRLAAHWIRARIARRSGELAAEASALHDALASAPAQGDAGHVHLALARLYEHRQKDLAAAYRHARFTEAWEGAVLHGRRLGRLRRKLEQR